MTRAARLSDFTRRTVEYVLESPDGDELVVTMRLLTRAETLAIEAKLPPRPEVPITRFEKDEDGHPQPIYDWQHPPYVQAISERNERMTKQYIADLWVLDEWDGKTDDERLADLDAMPSWAQLGLAQAARMAVGLAGNAPRPFRTDRDASHEGV